jgi:hypothetical protein
MSKPEALARVRELKKTIITATVLSFGAFAILVAGRLANASGNTSSSNTAGPSFSGDDNGTIQSSSDDGGYFGQGSRGSNFGNVGGSGFSSGPVTGSTVS